MAIMAGLNIYISIFKRIEMPDDPIGGSVQVISVSRSNLPARLTQRSSPWMLKAQGIVTETMYQCTVQSPDCTPLNIDSNDVVVPESGQYAGWQFHIMEVQDTSLDDWPNDCRGYHKALTLKKLTPNLRVA